MLLTLIVLLVVLWLLGYVSIPAIQIPDIRLFTINSHIITLWDVLIFMVLLAVIGILPGPFRQIAAALSLLWLLALLGLITITGLPNLLVVAIIVGLIAYSLSRSDKRSL
jgi:hypothetical protein